MMKYRSAALGAAFLCLVAVTLTACGSTDPDNAQTRAGISEAIVETAVGPDGVPFVSGLRIIDGKERGIVTLDIETPAGHKAHYQATDVLAFQGQEGRAQLEAVIAEAWKDAAPATVASLADTIIKLVSGGVP